MVFDFLKCEYKKAAMRGQATALEMILKLVNPKTAKIINARDEYGIKTATSTQ